MKEKIMRQVIAKQDELLNIYSDYVIGVANEFEGFDRGKDFCNPANKCITELASLKKQLKKAESVVTEYKLETLKLTPIPSGWICPRCQKVHSWMVQHCDCLPNVITASTTEPKEVAVNKVCINRDGRLCSNANSDYLRCPGECSEAEYPI